MKMRWLGAVSAVLFAFLGGGLSPRDSWEPTFKRGVNITDWVVDGAITTREEDLHWIASHGYDHVRLPFDATRIMERNGQLKPEALKSVDLVLQWARKERLGVVLDCHQFEGANFLPRALDERLFTDPKLQQKHARLWHQIAERYRSVGKVLRFDLLNEAVTSDSDAVNVLMERAVRAVRQVSSDRVLYVTGNNWSQFRFARYIRVFDDPNIIYVFHFYEPLIFTHQGTSYTEIGQKYKKPVKFPTYLTDLDKHFTKGVEGQDLLRFNRIPLDCNFVESEFGILAEWVKRKKVKVAINELGVFEAAPEDSASRWMACVRAQCEKYGFDWAVWEYRGGFGVRGKDGNPTAIHRGLWSGAARR